jgi:hypothetical protein
MTPQQLSHIAYHARLPVNKNLLAASLQDFTPMIPHFNLENVCKPGSTLLWDLVQDDKIVRPKILHAIDCYINVCIISQLIFFVCFSSILFLVGFVSREYSF